MDNKSENYIPENSEKPMEIEPLNTYNNRKHWFISFGIIFVILLFDQIFKIWIKKNMYLGQEINVLGNWFLLHYTENMGMAFGLELGGKYGKLILTFFRIFAVAFGVWVLWNQISKKAHTGFIICISLILSGAIGNIIDSVFYGVFFSDINHYSGGWFHGWVVDMLYFPLIEGFYPEWIPFKGGDYFIFFSPVFNIADSAITMGVLFILIFQKRFFPKTEEIEKIENIEEVEETLPKDDINTSST